MPMMITEIQMFSVMNVLFILFECFTHHVAADEGEQTENNPMVDGGHVFTERGRGEIAEQREKRLKSAEPEGGFERVEATQFFDGEAFADGHGERVHRYGNGDE